MNLLKFELVGQLKDGTPVSIDQLDIGGTISIIGADGTKSVAPDGDYTFEDGSVATVTNGKISAITSAPVDDNDTPTDEPASDEPAKDKPASDDVVSDADGEDDQEDDEIENQVAQMMDMIQELASKIAALEANQVAMKSDFESEKTMTSEKFAAASIVSVSIGKPVEAKPKTYQEKVLERVRLMNKN